MFYVEQIKLQMSCTLSIKKDKDSREGKGRRCCLEDRIYSIPCRASYFLFGLNEEYDEFITFFKIVLVQSS